MYKLTSGQQIPHMKRGKKIFFDKDEIDNMFYNEEDSLINELKLKKNVTFVKPTLDELLEKVKESGVDKLTKYEKQILDEYARN